MSGDRSADAVEGDVVGTTTFTARALQRLAVGIAHDAAHVAVRDVGVQLSDERGTLRITVTVPAAVATGAGSNLIESGEELRRGLIEGMRRLAGREVGTVDVRYSGIHRKREKRVR